MIAEAVAVGLFIGTLVGRYFIPAKKRARLVDVTLQKIDGTYRDPDTYEVSMQWDGEKEPKIYRVRTIDELPPDVRAFVKREFRAKHKWFDNLMTGKRPQDE